jgi:cytochrome c oxidase subunit 1
VPLLWQHLFWFYSHPAVYIMVVPAMGMASDVIAVHARKPIFGYKPMVYSMAAIAGLGFIVWGHHMFMSGMNPALGMTFMVSTIMIALPSAIKVFNWLGTLWGSRIRLTTPMLNALGFVAMFIIGGLSGIWMAATPVDIYIHDTYIVVAHFHYVVFAGSVFAIFAGIYHWFPKMFGRMMNETLGKIHFCGTFIFTNCVFYMMHQLGLAGLMRRTADPYAYDIYTHLQPLNQFISISAFCLFAWQIFFVINFFHSIFFGKRIGRNPWEACSLEWESPSPPGHGNFDHKLVVHRGPYEYGGPEVKEDYLRQARTI